MIFKIMTISFTGVVQNGRIDGFVHRTDKRILMS